jgi:hypothetical protein
MVERDKVADGLRPALWHGSPGPLILVETREHQNKVQQRTGQRPVPTRVLDSKSHMLFDDGSYKKFLFN